MAREGFDDALGASYRLIELCGRGAVGEVWRAEDRRTGEAVAAKLLRSEHASDRDLVGRFIQERSVLVGLRHPNLVSVRDLVVEGDRLAIVMDFVDGGSLRDALRVSGPLPPQLAVDVTAMVLDGLAAVHDDNLLHRDLKPDNVLLSQHWRQLQPGDVRLTDFGIAGIVGERARATTGMLGTPEYMSPEMITTGVVGLASDVYGVGVLLYELLGGRTPFAGPGTDYTVAHRHVTSQPKPLPVPEPLWEFLAQALDKDPRERPGAREAAAELRRLRAGLGGVPALPLQAEPDDFLAAVAPATVVRGLRPEEPAPAAPVESDTGSLDDLDLGTPGQATTVRPLPRPRPTSPRRAPSTEDEAPGRPWWRDPRLLMIVAGGVLVLVGAVVFALLAGHGGSGAVEGPAVAMRASQQDDPLPTGLTVSRAAAYDPESGTVELTITYAAQNAPLRGPFLEVMPRTRGDCPDVHWKDTEQQANLPTVTGVTARCAWSVDPGVLDAQHSASVTATVSVPLDANDGASALQSWLDREAAATTSAVSDPQISGAAYPVQRLQGIDVVAPASTVSGRTLPLTLYPVWPSGRDQTDPMYRSPSVGQPSTVLQAVAGGEEGVRFSDSCAGAVAVSSDGLVVTALSPTPSCEINARVGNLTDLTSNTFSIITRGG